MSGEARPRVVILAARAPWPPYTGDRLRAAVWLEALAGHADVTLVAPPWDERKLPIDGKFRHVPVKLSPMSLVRAASRLVGGALPAHFMIAGKYDWRAAAATASQHGPFDTAVVLLSRLDPWVRELLTARRWILDAVDALTLNMRERRIASRFPASLFWAREERATERIERAIPGRYDSVLVVSPGERQFFGSACEVISNGVEIGSEPPPVSSRRFDFGFWGRLAYFSNAAAARDLLGAIWPAIRRAHPGATLVIGGAEAPADIRAWDGRDGVTVVSPMEDRDAVVRQVRVALFPIRYGSGQASKFLEACEAGCAVVATDAALRGLDPAPTHVRRGEGAAELAARATELLYTPADIAETGSAGRRWVEQHYARSSTRRRLLSVALPERR